MKKLTYTTLTLVLWVATSIVSYAQDMTQLVNLEYQGEPLATVLDDIHDDYAVNFVYSRDYIPLSSSVHVSVQEAPLDHALDQVFRELPVSFKPIGGQIALKIDEEKQARLEQERLSLYKKAPVIIRNDRAISPIPTKKNNPIILQGAGGDYLSTLKYGHILGGQKEEKKSRLATRITLFPSTREDQGENNLALHLFWANSESINGFELGGVVNQVREDVKGLQIAGVGNVVGGDLNGSQTTIGVNMTLGCVHGVQVAGVSNIAGGKVHGVQFSGLFNYTETADRNVQIAGGANYSEGETAFQFGGVNYAEEITTGQISWLVNYAKKVDGFQIGLINISDTITQTPIGLFSYSKRGYNRLQVGGSDLLYLQLSSKFGVKKFYNIFEIGGRWDAIQHPNQQDINNREGVYMSWALGYGLGRAFTTSQRSMINVELVSMHLNEAKFWTQRLNLLNQLRFTFDYQTKGRVSWFIGPTIYVHVAQKTTTEPILLEQPSLIAPLLDTDNDNTRTTAWVGFNAGIRF